MHPPRVTDAAVELLIADLTHGNRPPSGARLRAALQERFGSRGGVSRVYRLLADARARLAPAPLVTDAEQLQHELQALRSRAERAEEREELHQSRWALEVDQLRLKVALLEPLARQARPAIESAGLLRHQLHAAEARIAALEQQLLQATQGEGRAEKP